MNAKELRIGNFVNYRTNNGLSIFEGIVKSISSNRIVVNNCCISIKLCNLYGIPITEEWLLKFGFKIIKFQNEGLVKYYDLTTPFEIIESIVPCHSIFRLRINNLEWKNCNLEFIHQLQNIYFNLTGKELGIKK